jgi:transketolase
LIPDDVKKHMGDAVQKGEHAHSKWRAKFAAYKAAHPELAAQLEMSIKGELPAGWDQGLPTFKDATATRSASGKILGALAAKIPWLVGGDADLGGSTKTIVTGGDFDRAGTQRNLRFGIREHAMGSIGNGMLYHGGLRPYVATFFAFSDYMRPPVRIAALNGQGAIFVWTHDSVGLGEDGPTHQPVEHLMALRAIPNLLVFRPADGNETIAAWKITMHNLTRPTALVLSRQDLPVLSPASDIAMKGGYVLADGTDVILIGTGSEVSTAMAARDLLAKDNISARVVSMPCWELFAEQPQDYRDSVLPPSQPKRVSVEAGVTLGWREYIGDRGIAIGIDRFGASAPGELVLEKLGISPQHVADAAKKLR